MSRWFGGINTNSRTVKGNPCSEMQYTSSIYIHFPQKMDVIVISRYPDAMLFSICRTNHISQALFPSLCHSSDILTAVAFRLRSRGLLHVASWMIMRRANHALFSYTLSRYNGGAHGDGAILRRSTSAPWPRSTSPSPNGTP